MSGGENQRFSPRPLRKRAVAAAPQFAQAHLALSVIYFNLGQLEQAAVAVQQALALEPHNDNIVNHRNTVQLAQQGASNKQMAPEVVALNSQAIALQAQGQHAQAEALLQQSLAIEPQNFLTLYSLGVSRSSQLDFASALHYFDLACQAAPKQALAHFAKGKTFRLGHWQSKNVADPYQHDQAVFDETCQLIQTYIADWKKYI